MRVIIRLSVLGLAAVSVVRGSVNNPADTTRPCDGWKVIWMAAAASDGTERNGGFLVTEGPTKGACPPDQAGTQRGVPWLMPWRSVACAHGMVVGINHQGQIHSTTEGLSWSRRESGTPSSLHSVAFGNGRFIAVGNEGAVVTSTDAAKWTSADAGTDERLRGVTFGHGLFVAVGYAGTILTSPDGGRWTPRASGTHVRLQGIAYGNGTFVAVGRQGVMLTSRTGTGWTRRSSGTSSCLSQVIFVECRPLTDVLTIRSADSTGEPCTIPILVNGQAEATTATNGSRGPSK